MSFSGRSVMAHRVPASYIVTSNMKPNEVLPNGPPRSYIWPVGPRIGDGMSPSTHRYLRDWSVAWRASGMSPSADTMLKTYDFQLWGYSIAAGGWISLSNVFRPGGQSFLETDLTSPIALVTHSNNPNGLIIEFPASRALHPYPTNTKPGAIDLADIKALVACHTSKIISASGVDLTGEIGKIVDAAGIDWWADTVTSTGNTECCHGPFGIVYPWERRFYATTMRIRELKLYGLPTAIPQHTGTSYTPGVDPDYVP
jgi:hypothetical protein